MSTGSRSAPMPACIRRSSRRPRRSRQRSSRELDTVYRDVHAPGRRVRASSTPASSTPPRAAGSSRASMPSRPDWSTSWAGCSSRSASPRQRPASTRPAGSSLRFPARKTLAQILDRVFRLAGVEPRPDRPRAARDPRRPGPLRHLRPPRQRPAAAPAAALEVATVACRAGRSSSTLKSDAAELWRQAQSTVFQSAPSSRRVRSIRSWRSCASTESVAIGRASRRFSAIGSPVSSQ